MQGYLCSLSLLYLACLCLSFVVGVFMYLNLKKKRDGNYDYRGGVYGHVQAEFSSIERAAPLLSSGPSLALLRGPLLTRGQIKRKQEERHTSELSPGYNPTTRPHKEASGDRHSP